MLHRIVGRSVVVLAATALLASCEDNTAGTPLPPPPPSTAVYLNAVAPVPTNGVVDTDLSTPVVVEATYPDGAAAPGVVITFNLNQPGLIAQTKATTDAAGRASPGTWHLGLTSGTQTVVATPASGSPTTVDVTVAPDAFLRTIGPPGLNGKRIRVGTVATTAAVFTGVDRFYNRVGVGTAITLTALQGTLSAAGAKTTNSVGNVSGGTWTLSGTAGPQRLVASYTINAVPRADTVTVTAIP